MSHAIPPTTPVTAVVVDTEGRGRQEAWTPAPDGTLITHLQGAVQGRFDVVRLAGNLDMWVNDEGLYLCEPNPVGSAIASAHGFTAQPYFGTVVFTGGASPDGSTLSLSQPQADWLLAIAREALADPVALAAVRARCLDAVAHLR